MQNPASGFTLIELLVVISIIVILGALAFPAIQGALDRAKRVQAKNDVVQIVTAVNAFNTEFGRYPLPPNTNAADYTYGGTGDGSDNTNNQLFDALRGTAGYGWQSDLNARKIAFISPPVAKSV